VVEDNMQSQRRIYETCLDFDPQRPNATVMLNNAEWLSKLSFVEALRDLGKHFSINQMLQRDAIRERLIKREQGISYTEFSYALLQAYDFQYLFQHHQVTIQLGGSDQWGNIVAGVDLVRRVHNQQVYGLTCPLVTKSDGGKFGKTEAGPIWLTAERTSPYQLYQFFINTADVDVHRYLLLFTFLSLAAIDTLMAQHTADPAQRLAQRVLAREVTSMMHGVAATEVETAAQSLFSGDLTGCSLHTLTEVLAGAPTTHHRLTDLHDPGLPVIELLCAASICASKRQARELLAAGAILLNGHQATLEDRLTVAQLLHGRIAAIRRGKKAWHVTMWD
jgi:tyrosyl-tRNA synthetase